MLEIYKCLTRLAISSGIKDLADERLEQLFWSRFGDQEILSQRFVCKELGQKRNARDEQVNKMFDSFVTHFADYLRAESLAGAIRRSGGADDVGVVEIASAFNVNPSERAISNLLELHGFDSSGVNKLNRRANEEFWNVKSHAKLDVSDGLEVSEMQTLD